MPNNSRPTERLSRYINLITQGSSEPPCSAGDRSQGYSLGKNLLVRKKIANYKLITSQQSVYKQVGKRLGVREAITEEEASEHSIFEVFRNYFCCKKVIT